MIFDRCHSDTLNTLTARRFANNEAAAAHRRIKSVRVNTHGRSWAQWQTRGSRLHKDELGGPRVVGRDSLAWVGSAARVVRLHPVAKGPDGPAALEGRGRARDCACKSTTVEWQGTSGFYDNDSWSLNSAICACDLRRRLAQAICAGALRQESSSLN
eukprot:113182-Pleurochrysis_carterae.AAC.1